jgi:hypothetical protein
MTCPGIFRSLASSGRWLLQVAGFYRSLAFTGRWLLQVALPFLICARTRRAQIGADGCILGDGKPHEPSSFAKDCGKVYDFMKRKKLLVDKFFLEKKGAGEK